MLVVYGPTVTGKTDFALGLSKKYNGELISADSRQVYKGLDIGSGKISPLLETKKHIGYWFVDGIKVNGYDLVNPGTTFNAADFINFAIDAQNKIEIEEKLPIVVGGTGFYIKSLISGIDTVGIPINKQIREKLINYNAVDLFRELEKTNKNAALKLNESDSKNPRRLVRAIEVEVYRRSNDLKNQKQIKSASKLTLGLNAPNDFLFKKADNWLKTRISLGLFEEVDLLIKKGVSSQWLTSLGLEYKWATQFLLGKINKETAIKRLQGDIHGFIRRQKTWFRQFPEISVLDITDKSWESKAKKLILKSHLFGG